MYSSFRSHPSVSIVPNKNRRPCPNHAIILNIKAKIKSRNRDRNNNNTLETKGKHVVNIFIVATYHRRHHHHHHRSRHIISIIVIVIIIMYARNDRIG